MRSVIRSIATCLVCLPLLAACSGNKNPLEVTVERCPAIAVIGGAGTLTEFAGSGRTADDVLFEATISDVSLACDQDSDVVSDVRFSIVVQRGPALTGAMDIAIPYFVAVLRDNSEIVAKEIYAADIRLGAGDQRTIRRERIRQILPTIEQARRYDYEILIGFQLDPEHAAYNLVR